MKKMINVMILLLCLMLAFGASAEIAEDAAAYDVSTVLSLTDEAGAWDMMMTVHGDGWTEVIIEHVLDDATTDMWLIEIPESVGTEGGAVSYTGAVVRTMVLDENGDLLSDEVIAENAAGTMNLLEDGVLEWTDETTETSCVFGVVSIMYISNYSDVVSERATMVVTGDPTDDAAALTAEIFWGDSAESSVTWHMILQPTATMNGFTYTDAVCTRVTVTEDGDVSEEVLYENGTGSFALMDDGSLQWTDDTDGTGTGCLFVLDTL